MRFASVAGTGLALAGLSLVVVTAQDAPASPHEVAVKEMLATLEKLGTIVGTIADETSAAVAKAELNKGVKQMLEARRKAEALPQPSKEEKDRLAVAYQRKFIQAMDRLRLEMVRAQIIPGGKEALDELKPLEPPPKSK